MTRSALAVIGANLGDYVSRRFNPNVIVRFNGGSQCSHTAETPEGKRHVFRQVGSGVLANPRAPTFLSRFVVFNPAVFEKEVYDLERLDVQPIVVLDERAPLATCLDTFTNITIEKARGEFRHGSCGHGINETVTRNQHPEYQTTARDLLHLSALREKLYRILNEYTCIRLFECGLSQKEAKRQVAYFKERPFAIESYLEACMAIRPMVGIVPDIAYILSRSPEYDIIFEGAQGLLLDEHHKWFPHVTRSRTGMTNVETLCEEIGVTHADISYVTRTYLTRHGEGPLPFEKTRGFDHIVDNTNIYNVDQGLLRFAPLNLDLLIQSISNDLSKVKLPHTVNLMMTWAHLFSTRPWDFVVNDEQEEGTLDEALKEICKVVDLDSVYLSTKPTRKGISCYASSAVTTGD